MSPCRPHGLKHSKHPHPSPSPGVCPSSCSLHWWYHPTISSSDALLSFCPWSVPASGTFLMSHLFTSDNQSTGASASVSVLPVDMQGWSPLRLTGLISLLSKGLSGVFSSTTVQRHTYFDILPVLWSSSHTVHDQWEDYQLDSTDLCRQSNVCFSSCYLGFLLLFCQEAIISDFMAVITIHGDFGAQEEEICHCFYILTFL